MNCKIVEGYTCIGNYGGSSICFKETLEPKQPKCGDAIIDQGEQCDNGNKPGCSSNCVVDAGYKCTGIVGSSSVCLLCGNGIKEGSEECDNPSSPGCSKDCKVNPGYFCRGVYSMCFRSDPVCGNNVGEIAESCDDGNLVDGDGCNKHCLI